MKRVVAIGDLHCGHFVGLTPPIYQSRNPELRAVQKRLWGFYVEAIKALQPIDVLIVNGDAIDGRGERSGGTELLTTDRKEQALMAVECIRQAKAKQIFMTFGTPYHTGASEDWESYIAERLGATIEGHLFLDVDGVTFSVKHKVGSSSVPYGRHTAASKENTWNALLAEEGSAPRADVFIRSHVHYFTHGGDARKLYLTLPALQGPGSKFGERQCSGLVDFGLVHFDIEQGKYSWNWHTLPVAVKAPLHKA